MAADKAQQLQIELNEEKAQGVYSNLAVITHSSSEFVIDFVSVMPNVEKSSVRARVIMAPEHVRRLLSALQENVIKYERVYGRIVLPEDKKLGGDPAGGTFMPPLAGYRGGDA